MRAILGSVVAPVIAALILVPMALVGVAFQLPWLAPSIGSAVLTQTLTPTARSAAPWPLAAGQVAGALGGFAGVFLAHAAFLPHFTTGDPLVSRRVVALLIGVPVGMVLQMLLRARSPAGGATILVVAFGLETADASGALRLLAAIGVATGLGELGRRVILRFEPERPTQS